LAAGLDGGGLNPEAVSMPRSRWADGREQARRCTRSACLLSSCASAPDLLPQGIEHARLGDEHGVGRQAQLGGDPFSQEPRGPLLLLLFSRVLAHVPELGTVQADAGCDVVLVTNEPETGRAQ
jgi:hypothetical protein